MITLKFTSKTVIEMLMKIGLRITPVGRFDFGHIDRKQANFTQGHE
jgi:hypothetical protein